MPKKYLVEDKEFALDNCKILYHDLHKPCTETCMCWGWEIGEGFYSVMKELSVKLEMLNLLFSRKYGVSVVLDQVKSKFGLLTVYHSVRISSPLIYRIWSVPFEKAYYFLRRHVNYKYKTVIDKEAYETDEKQEIPAGELAKRRAAVKHISNAKIIKEDGKWFEVTKLYHCRTTHTEPTRYRFVHFVQQLMWKLSIIMSFHREPSKSQLVIRDAVDAIATKYIREAEGQCYEVCEDCGTQIGTKWSPRVTTKGWISYICRHCDAKRRIRHAKAEIDGYLSENNDGLSKAESKAYDAAVKAVDSDEYVPTEELEKHAVKIERIANEK